jgi:hypothetical protein
VKKAGQVEGLVLSEGMNQIAQGWINEPFILLCVGLSAADGFGRMMMTSLWVLDIVI